MTPLTREVLAAREAPEQPSDMLRQLRLDIERIDRENEREARRHMVKIIVSTAVVLPLIHVLLGWIL